MVFSSVFSTSPVADVVCSVLVKGLGCGSTVYCEGRTAELFGCLQCPSWAGVCAVGGFPSQEGPGAMSYPELGAAGIHMLLKSLTLTY